MELALLSISRERMSLVSLASCPQVPRPHTFSPALNLVPDPPTLSPSPAEAQERGAGGGSCSASPPSSQLAPPLAPQPAEPQGPMAFPKRVTGPAAELVVPRISRSQGAGHAEPACPHGPLPVHRLPVPPSSSFQVPRHVPRQGGGICKGEPAGEAETKDENRGNQ